VDFATGLVRMVREVLKDRVVVRRARKVRIGQSAEHRASETRHRNRRACRVEDAGSWIANVHRQDALFLRRGGDGRERRQLAILPESLVIAEEERLVLQDWAAEHAAELMSPQRRLLARRGLEVTGRVERGVAEEFP